MGCADAGWDALGQRSATTTCRALQPSMQHGPAFHTPARDAAARAAGGTTREPETGLMVRREWMRPSEFEISCRNELYGRSPRFRNPLNPPGAEERLAAGSTQPLLPRRGARRQDHRRGVPPTVRPALLHERARTRRSGGAAGIRTPDLCRARAALSQLSYRPLGCLSVRPPGSGLADRRAQLARRCQRVFLSIFLCLWRRIFLRRFLMTEPTSYRSRPGRGLEPPPARW